MGGSGGQPDGLVSAAEGGGSVRDIFGRVMEEEGLSFPEAVELVAREVELVRGALAGLVGRLEELHADPAYRSVWAALDGLAGAWEGRP